MQDSYRSDCGCLDQSNSRVNEIYEQISKADAPYAMAYVPYQQWNQIYDPSRALRAGTIFPCLDKPFCGKGGACL